MSQEEWTTYIYRGREVDRIRYGFEPKRSSYPKECPGCGVKQRRFHVLGCRQEYCGCGCKGKAVDCKSEAEEEE